MSKTIPIRNGPQVNFRLPTNARGALARLKRKTGWSKVKVVTEALISAEQTDFGSVTNTQTTKEK
jgi:hypothetical protein